MASEPEFPKVTISSSGTSVSINNRPANPMLGEVAMGLSIEKAHLLHARLSAALGMPPSPDYARGRQAGLREAAEVAKNRAQQIRQQTERIYGDGLEGFGAHLLADEFDRVAAAILALVGKGE